MKYSHKEMNAQLCVPSHWLLTAAVGPLLTTQPNVYGDLNRENTLSHMAPPTEDDTPHTLL